MGLQKTTIQCQTGYFARATENGHRATHTRVHLVSGNTALCGYMPHPSMRFQFCASFAYLPYVECDKCRDKYFAMGGESKDTKQLLEDLKVLENARVGLSEKQHIDGIDRMIADIKKKLSTFCRRKNISRLSLF